MKFDKINVQNPMEAQSIFTSPRNKMPLLSSPSSADRPNFNLTGSSSVFNTKKNTQAFVLEKEDQDFERGCSSRRSQQIEKMSMLPSTRSLGRNRFVTSKFN
jgi:hypothetical protein